MGSSHSKKKQQTKTQTLPAFIGGAIWLESQLTASTRVPSVSPPDDFRGGTHTYYTQRDTDRLTCYNHTHTII